MSAEYDRLAEATTRALLLVRLAEMACEDAERSLLAALGQPPPLREET